MSLTNGLARAVKRSRPLSVFLSRPGTCGGPGESVRLRVNLSPMTANDGVVTGTGDPEELRPQRTTEYEDTLANPYAAAERGYIDAVIRPAETRAQVTRALTALRTKRETLPPKKHGNIPL